MPLAFAGIIVGGRHTECACYLKVDGIGLTPYRFKIRHNGLKVDDIGLTPFHGN